MIGWLFAVGRMVGFGSAAGVRPALTLAVIGAMSLVGIGPDVQPPFLFLERWWVILIFAVLAILEGKFDNVPKLDRIQDRILVPWRIAIGGVAAAATVPHGVTGLVVGLTVGAAFGWLSQSVKHGSRPIQPPSGLAVALISLSEDLYALGGVVATAIFSPLGYVFAAVNIWLFVRLRRRRRLRYRTKRGLADRSQ
jgi:uncharacterized membrane protein